MSSRSTSQGWRWSSSGEDHHTQLQLNSDHTTQRLTALTQQVKRLQTEKDSYQKELATLRLQLQDREHLTSHISGERAAAQCARLGLELNSEEEWPLKASFEIAYSVYIYTAEELLQESSISRPLEVASQLLVEEPQCSDSASKSYRTKVLQRLQEIVENQQDILAMQRQLLAAVAVTMTEEDGFFSVKWAMPNSGGSADP
ncbi:uncharacterized protein LOC113085048 [Carassius auratus]|uniref:Uncharacterized protein LOC113085048 n=1 Tax=Carassius auratus TaxID=7957 RepID=A0A6P6NQJ1_CARAU|nr:uncharacterized protein LOC113085048 [Carassius auratus]